jgi:hypothetical protein
MSLKKNALKMQMQRSQTSSASIVTPNTIFPNALAMLRANGSILLPMLPQCAKLKVYLNEQYLHSLHVRKLGVNLVGNQNRLLDLLGFALHGLDLAVLTLVWSPDIVFFVAVGVSLNAAASRLGGDVTTWGRRGAGGLVDELRDGSVDVAVVVRECLANGCIVGQEWERGSDRVDHPFGDVRPLVGFCLGGGDLLLRSDVDFGEASEWTSNITN